jgi:excisionase family DNA binding protein|tara:strand:- start:811 stop:1008 length:198 start_codon:yes stop_codon:yes gene_type:complete
MDNEFYTINEVAEMLRSSNRTITNWIKSGDISVLHLSHKKKLISKAEIERFVSERTTAHNRVGTP